jgi:hypothetical protein
MRLPILAQNISAARTNFVGFEKSAAEGIAVGRRKSTKRLDCRLASTSRQRATGEFIPDDRSACLELY